MKRFIWLFIILALLVLAGCTTLPTYRIQPPWNRILSGTDEILPVKSSVSVEVTGETMPLVGNEELTSSKIRDNAVWLLERRGYVINQSGNQYKMNIIYKTQKETKNFSYQSATSVSSTAMFTYYGSSYRRSQFGYGVLIAQAIGALAAASSKSATTNYKYDYDSYCHVIVFEIYNNENILQWKSDVTWSSGQLDILQNTIVAMQTAFSALPSDMASYTNVPKIKNDRVKDYLKDRLQTNKFTSPALPYITRFNADVSKINNPTASAAYFDLLQTAEFALPGKESGWDKPMDPNLWKKVTLGGRYKLGQQNEPVNVLVTLSSDAYGYIIQKCNVVSDSEYNEFLRLMNLWKKALNDYYDFYE